MNSVEPLNLASAIRCSVALPAGFRVDDILDFYRRDPLSVGERVSGRTLQKGLVWQGRPAYLIAEFTAAHANFVLASEQAADHDVESFAAMAHHMLGLDQSIEDFERRHRNHPQLGPLIVRQAGLRVPTFPAPFEALIWAVMGQQISLAAALAIRRNVIRLAGPLLSSGLRCFPDARHIADASEAQLRGAGLSGAKARTIRLLSQAIIDQRLSLDIRSSHTSAEEIRDALMCIPGVGPWTANYALVRGFGWLDSSLHGDAAVRRKLQQLLGKKEKVSSQFAERWLAGFSPWRGLAAAHLWAM